MTQERELVEEDGRYPALLRGCTLAVYAFQLLELALLASLVLDFDALGSERRRRAQTLVMGVLLLTGEDRVVRTGELHHPGGDTASRRPCLLGATALACGGERLSPHA